MANVLVPFPGASARDVETLVATPAEQVLAQMSGIEHVYSVSRPGMAVLTVQFKVGVPHTEALVRLYNTVNSNRDWVSPNLGIGEPIIKPKGIDDVPVVTLTLWSEDPQAGAYELERAAHAAEVELKRVPRHARGADAGRPGARAARADGRRPHERARHRAARPEERAAARQCVAARRAASCATTARWWSRPTTTWNRPRTWRAWWSARTTAGPVYVSDVAQVLDGPLQPARYVWTRQREGRASGGHAAGDQEARRERGGRGRARGRARRRAARQRHSRRRARERHAQLRRHRQRQGAAAHQEAHLRHAVGDRARVRDARLARGADRGHRGAAHAGERRCSPPGRGASR